jgi:hypothetical protein
VVDGQAALPVMQIKWRTSYSKAAVRLQLRSS